MINETKASEILNFQVRRDIIALYKRFLMTLEDVRYEHDSMISKTKKLIPQEYHSIIDSTKYFNDETFNRFRKRILDSGNESIRGIEEQIKQFDVGFGL